MWDGSGAKFAGLYEIDGNMTDEELNALAKVIAERMNAAATDQDHGMSQ